MWATTAGADARHAVRRGTATAALAVCLLFGSRAIEAVAQSASEPRIPLDAGPSEQLRYSGLTELTPQNVRQLRPLFAVRASIDGAPLSRSHTDGAMRAGTAQFGSQATADAHLRRLVNWRATLLRAPLAPRDPSSAVDPAITYIVGSGTLGSGKRAAAPQAAAQVTAWDQTNGRILWTAREESPIRSGAVLTAGGLVFYFSNDRWLKALDARTGEILWQERLASVQHGQILSYEGGDGHQYVGVLTDVSGESGTLQSFSLPR
jgi:putative pyrroloquinoline-quinone binding quinoprotein